MAPTTFEQGIAIEQLSDTTFRSLTTPWTWPRSTVVPGGILMALAANAAYATNHPGLDLDTLSCHFLAAPVAQKPFDLRVQRLADSGRFCSRVVELLQEGKVKVHVTCSFVRSAAMTGRAMAHAVTRWSGQRLGGEKGMTLDDLEVERTDRGPYMRFQRLPLLSLASSNQQQPPAPETLLYTSAAQIQPLSTSANRSPHLPTLALVALSDYHILDCPPTVHGLSAGTPRINDNTRTPTASNFTFMTSLNHSIRFHNVGDWDAAGLVYVEAWCPWTGGRRGQVESRIFSEGGRLLASCVQEAYFVMKDGEGGERGWVMEEGEEVGRGERSKL